MALLKEGLAQVNILHFSCNISRVLLRRTVYE
jgi:hypothetical protein